MASKVRLESIALHVETDSDADTSTLGEWTDALDDWCIVRATGEYVRDTIDAAADEDGESNPDFPEKGREYRCFRPYASGEAPGTDSYKQYGLQDWKRMEGLCNGDWCYIGVYATAEVSYDIGNGARRLETLRSPGLWGFESDCGDYAATVADEELSELKDHLRTFGVSLRRFAALAREAKEKMADTHSFA